FTGTISLSNVNGQQITLLDSNSVGVIHNDDETMVTIADVSEAEDEDGTITVTVLLDGDVQGGFTVDANTSDGTATTADSDYTAVMSETLTFAGTSGETHTFDIAVGGDDKVEEDEIFGVSLDNLLPTEVIASDIDITGEATITVTNDDEAFISQVEFPAAGLYKDEDQLRFTIAYNNPVTVSGQLTIPVILATGTVDAVYDDINSTSTRLVFNYQVEQGNYDDDGLNVGEEIQLRTGKITDILGENAVLSTNGISENIVRIDAVYPTLKTTPETNISTISDHSQGQDQFYVTLNFDEAMNRSMIPEIVFDKDIENSVVFGTDSSYWKSDSTYLAFYQVKDTNAEIIDIGMTIAAATDVAGNEIFSDKRTNIFKIDTKNPILSISTSSVDSITTDSVLFSISISDSLGIESFEIDPSELIINTSRSVEPNITTVKTDSSINVIFSNVEGVGRLSFQVPEGVGLDSAGNRSAISAISDTVLVRKTLSVQAQAKTMTYGGVVPELTYTLTGFAGTDNLDSLDQVPVLKTDAFQYGCPSIPYQIQFEFGGRDEYYLFDTVASSISFIKKDLLFSADNKTMIYGDIVPEFTYSLSNSFVNGDDITDVNILPLLASKVSSASSVGVYEVNFNAENAFDECYEIRTNSGEVRVLKAPLNLIVMDKDTLRVPEPNELTFNFDVNPAIGLRNEDEISVLGSVYQYQLEPQGTDSVYQIDIAGFDPLNYEVSIQPGLLRLFDPTEISTLSSNQELCAFVEMELEVLTKGFFFDRLDWEYRKNEGESFQSVQGDTRFIGSDSTILVADTILSDWNGFQFRARAISEFGVDVFSETINLVVPESPPPAYIEKKGEKLLVALYEGEDAIFQWKLNDEEIPGAVNEFYYAPDSIDHDKDLYSVVLTYASGCSTESEYGFLDASPFENTDIFNSEPEIPVTIAPNPSNGVFTVVWNNAYTGPASYKVINVFGEQIMYQEIRKDAIIEDISINLLDANNPFSAGIHFLVITYGSNVVSQKVFIRP
ncbi:MAG: MBG domain-containing protein, partial [Cyclobacteriaceae bacterium]